MKIHDIDDSNIDAILKITDLENMFDVYVDKNLNNMFNLNKTLYIKIEQSSLPTFQCTHQMHWTLISYKIYGTTRLAWLLWKINDVSIEDSLKAKQPGDIIKYLPKNYVNSIITDITNFNK